MIEFALINDVVDEQTRVEYEKEGRQCISIQSVRSFLNENKSEDIQFNISTLGGDLATAITIHDLIKTHPGKTIGKITGLTASAGTVIADACDEVVMNDNALFLIHNGWGSVTGNVYDFQKAVSNFSKTDAIMIKIYRERTGLADEKIKELMQASDWLTPTEALEYGFIDTINDTGQKIAASLTEQQRNYFNTNLLTKLEEKMKIFGKEKKDVPVMEVLALKDGTRLLINAEIPQTGTEISPLGAAMLEDGEYELADGKKITVAGGIITNVTDPAAEPEMEASSQEIIAAVTEVVNSAIAQVQTDVSKMKADLQTEINAKFASISSQHVPAKGIGADNGGKKAVVNIQSKIKSVTDEIRDNIIKSRQA